MNYFEGPAYDPEADGVIEEEQSSLSVQQPSSELTSSGNLLIMTVAID